METYPPSEIVNIIALLIPCIMGTIGNLLVIYILAWKKRNHRKPFENLLSILAVVDLFASVIVPVLFLYGAITKYKRWDFGYIGCKLISSFFPVSVTFSEGILVLISYERYKTIKDPLGGAPVKRNFIALWLLGTLLIALLLVSPYVHVLELISSRAYNIHTCMPSGKKHTTLMVYSAGNVLRDLTATLSMIILGVLTNRVLRDSGCQTSTVNGFQNSRRRKNLLKARSMLVVVVCVFSVCVIPLDVFQFVIYALYQVGYQFSQDNYESVLTCNSVLSVLQIMNSATNVIIYARMHKDFTSRQFFRSVRKAFRRNVSQMLSTYRVNNDEKKRELHSGLLKSNTLTRS